MFDIQDNTLGFPILSLIVYVPVLTAIALLFLKEKGVIQKVAMAGALITFVLSIIALVAYLTTNASSRGGVASFQLQENFTWLSTTDATGAPVGGGLNIGYHMGVDTISILLVVLTTLLTPISLWVSWEPIQKRVKEYYIVFLLLEAGMLGVFVSLDFFVFYIFWEVMLVPMALIIGVWGSSNRVYAAVKFFLYTLAGSLLMLVAIIALYLQHSTLDILRLMELGPGDPRDFQNWVFLAFAAAFAIKVPMFPFHTWLPDAHVEAPTAGSIILAGVLLKMGAYGFIRFAMPITPAGAATFADIMIGLSVIAIIYGALVSLVQPDLKKLIAYSSVSHMGFVTLGLFTGVLMNRAPGLQERGQASVNLATQGVDGAIIVILSHGLLTGGLFLCVGVIYNRLHSRQIADMGGITKPMPLFGTMFMFMMLGSVGLPGLSGFIGEFLAMQGAFRADWLVGTITAAVVIFAAWYLFWMFQRVMFGKTVAEAKRFPDLNLAEGVSLGVLAAGAIVMGVFPGPILEMIAPASQHLIATVTAQIPNAASFTHIFFR
ncbi:MAG TPA: NADH-quinone oxidoreductase subunit M [Chloroflexia bacterium]|nr:NADH-quinone oxidoreductase subunit M [Chloroflexia bacterium]